MRLFCWNVNSLVPTVRNVNLKYGSLAAFFAHLDADIVCMQEVKLPDSKLTKDLVIVEGYQSYWACSHSKTGYSGVTTWARVGCAAHAAHADPFTCEGCDREGRVLMTDHGRFVLFNVYVPNAGERPERARLAAKLSFLAALKQQVDELLGSGRQVILVGDFNIAAEQRDIHPSITWDTLYHPAELKALHDLMAPSGSSCTDTWRHLHPHTDQVYTVWEERTSARAFNVGLRIDYALVSSSLLDQVVSSEVLLDLPPKWSDHAPLLLELLSLTPPPHNPLTPDTDTGTSTAHREAATSEHRRPGAPDTQHQLQLLHPQAPPESPMWQQLLRRFQDPSQRSIASMFKAAAQRPSSTTRHKVAKTPPMARAGPGNAPQAHSATATIAASPSALPQHEQGLPASEAAGAASNFEAGSSSKQQQKQPTPQAPNGQSAAPLPQQTTRQMQPEHQSCQAGLQQAGSTTSVKPAGSRSGPSSAGGGGGGGQPRGTKRKPQGSSKASASTAAACPKQAKLHTFFSAAAPAGRTSPPPQNP